MKFTFPGEYSYIYILSETVPQERLRNEAWEIWRPTSVCFMQGDRRRVLLEGYVFRNTVCLKKRTKGSQHDSLGRSMDLVSRQWSEACGD